MHKILIVDDIFVNRLLLKEVVKNICSQCFEAQNGKEAIDIIQKVAKINKPIVSKNIERKNEIISVIADIQKAKEELKWEPLYNFEDGIKEILENIKNEK